MCENGRKCRATGAKSLAKTSAAVVATLLWVVVVAPSAGLQWTAETAIATSSTDGGGGLDAHRRLSTDHYGGTTADTVRPDSGRVVAARPTGRHGQRARIAQTTMTVDTDFSVGRSRPPPKNRVRRLPRANGGTTIDTSTVDGSYTMTTSWSKVSGSEALSAAHRGNKSTVKIRNALKNFDASIPSVIYDRINDTRGFGETIQAGRQSNHNDNSNAETDDWLTEQDVLNGNGYLNGNLNSYTFTNNMGHIDHKATYPADSNELNLRPLADLQSRYTVVNGPYPNQHISQPPRIINQTPNYQLSSTNIQPVNTNFQPVNTYNQPVRTNIQPVGTNIQPVNTNIQPVNTYVQPANTYVQPANTYVQPANAYVQPANAYVQPANAYVQPVNTFVQPSNTDVSPSSTNYQPSSITSSQNQIPSSENNTGMIQRLQKLILSNGEFDWRMIGIIALAKLILINLKAFTFVNVFLFVLFQIKLFAFIVYLKSVIILRVSKFFKIPIESFINVFFK